MSYSSTTTPRNKYTTDSIYYDDSTRIMPETDLSEQSSSESSVNNTNQNVPSTAVNGINRSSPATPVPNRNRRNYSCIMLNTNKSPTKILGGPKNQKFKPGGKMHCDIHGDIHLHPVHRAIIDTPQFQRLRHTKQLGMASFVYATATHTRFEHCIGVSHLAERLLNNLMKNWHDQDCQTYELKKAITETDLLCVRTAALIHDLGHGPWSHAWDSSIVAEEDRKSKNDENPDDPLWTHEIGSGKLLDHILETNEDVFSIFEKFSLNEPANLEFIKELISAEESAIEKNWPFKSRPETHAWLFEIVSNHRFGVDVDRLDYLMRDATKCGLEASCQNATSRYIDDARINIHPETKRPIITVPEKDRTTLFSGVFSLRYNMHKKVYQHKTVKKIELMCRDMLVESRDVLKDTYDKNFPSLQYAHRNMKYYSILTEGLLEGQIRLTEFHREQRIVKKYEKAREILDRIYTRKLYRGIETTKVPMDARKLDSNKSPDKFLEHLKSFSSSWTPKRKNQLNPAKRVKRDLFENSVTESSSEETSGAHSDFGAFINKALEDNLFEVVKFKFHHGQGKSNPLKNLYYFSKDDGSLLKSEELDPSVLPSCFSSVQFMLVYKGQDRIVDELKNAISKVFNNYFS